MKSYVASFAGLVAYVLFTASLAGADTAAKPLRLQARAGIVAQVVEVHVRKAPPP